MTLKIYILRAANLVVIFSCMTLLQWHGIQFWVSYIENFFVAIGWSLLLELVAFWSWFQRRQGNTLVMHILIRGIATIATILLLVGPLYAVSVDFLRSYETTYVQTTDYQERREVLMRQIADKQQASRELLQHIRENDDGWVTYNRTQRDLERLREELTNLKAPTERTTIPWQEIIVISMQALAIIIFQLIIVIAILKTARLQPAEELPVQEQRPLTYRELLEARKAGERKEEEG